MGNENSLRKKHYLKHQTVKRNVLVIMFSLIYRFLALSGSAKSPYNAQKLFRLKKPKNKTNKRLFITL